MVLYQLYMKRKGTKRWLKAGYPRKYETVKREWKSWKTSKKYDVKMKRAYPKR